jgi:hypothetical protein
MFGVIMVNVLGNTYPNINNSESFVINIYLYAIYY